MAKSIIRDGTSQAERLLPALAEGYVSVDEMRFQDLLALSAQYAGLLRYADASGRGDEDWKALFESDEASVLASMLVVNLKRTEAEFARCMREWAAVSARLRAGDAAMDAALPGFALARRIDDWFVKLGALSSVAAVRAQERIAELIEKQLGRELWTLRAFARRLNEGAAMSAFAEFDAVWNLDADEADFQEPDEAQTGQFLKANFYAFHNAVLFLRESAAELLKLSLERHDHDPAMGLFIAFLRLFAGVQRKINGFTAKHLAFYYGDILKAPRRGGVPDSVPLLFTPDVAGREVFIAKGTEFRAGMDENGTELIYEADDDLLVTDAKVCALHTVYIERDELSSPENALTSSPGGEDGAHQFATAIKLNRISEAGKDLRAELDGATAQPLFGDPQRYGKTRLFEEARVGFAIASSVLLLKQGQRDVVVTFRLAPAEADSGLDVFVRRLAGILGTTEADAFFKAFRHMFQVSLTGETGWFDAGEYLPLCHLVDGENCEENCFRIQLRLSDGAGAVVPYSPALHGEAFDTDLPMIRFTLNPGAYLYPYSLLSETVVREIVIEAGVTGCTDVLVYNHLGQLSADAQFTPFGPLPAKGDYFVVGCYEAVRKKLTAFEVEIEWAGLPPEMRSFEDYYRAYSMAFTNKLFKVRLAVLKDRKWLPTEEGEQPRAALFDSTAGPDGDKKVAVRRRLSFDALCRFLRPLEDVAEDQYGYSAVAKDGFFKLTLDSPPYAFGHREYPLILSQAMTQLSRIRRFAFLRQMLRLRVRPPIPLPKQPYTPMVNSVSVNYRAVSGISLEQVASSEEGRLKERLFHLHPMGLEALSPRAYGKIPLAPHYGADGNLLIGISATKLSGLLTLFFHLRQDSLPEAGAQPFRFTWHYLAANQWKQLKPSQVVSDGTHGFLTSGIVALDLPPDISSDNTILPGGLYWLRVSAEGRRLYTLCSLYAVHAQALKATWKPQEGNALSHLAVKLPAGTIREPKISMPGIAEIRQIVDSSGGAPAESPEQWTIRVSERLKHKNRAVAPWDYERLVLQHFPEIYKVKCFPCMSGREGQGGRHEPGQLLIVLIPYPKEAAAVNLQPMVNAQLLRDVREFVQGLSSGFAKINVRNPAYEPIQVRCRVRFRRGAEHGRCLNRMNLAIFDYLSPWSPGGHEAGFGWRIRCNEIQSCLQELDYVESVSGLSLLQVRDTGGGRRQLYDTARLQRDEVGPTWPWSIAVPFSRQLIEVVDERGVWAPQETGIADLAIGSSFVLSRGNS